MRATIRSLTFQNFNTTILETVKLARVAAKKDGRKRPVLPFTSMFNLKGSWTINGTKYSRKESSFLTNDDAAVEYLMPYSLGADGVVIWSGLGEKLALDRDSQVGF